jgi:hypothetical protein
MKCVQVDISRPGDHREGGLVQPPRQDLPAARVLLAGARDHHDRLPLVPGRGIGTQVSRHSLASYVHAARQAHRPPMGALPAERLPRPRQVQRIGLRECP